MKITRKKLNMLIESYLKESDEKTVPDDKFVDMLDKQQKKQEKNIQAVTDFRKGSDRGQFPPLTFGPGVDDEGNLEDGKFTTVHDYHEPDPYDHGAVRRYKKQHYLGPDDKSVDDPEITRMEFDMKDQLVRQTIMSTQEDVQEIKSSIIRLEEKIDDLK